VSSRASPAAELTAPVAADALDTADFEQYACMRLWPIAARDHVDRVVAALHADGQRAALGGAVPELAGCVGSPAVHHPIVGDRARVGRADRELAYRRQALDA
jgi:hypothetical protein